MTLNDIGRNLERIRTDKNMSAYELSRCIEKDVNYIRKVEKGELNMSMKVLFDICEILEIHPRELFQ